MKAALAPSDRDDGLDRSFLESQGLSVEGGEPTAAGGVRVRDLDRFVHATGA